MCGARTKADWRRTSALMVAIESLFSETEIRLDKYMPENLRVLARQAEPRRGIHALKQFCKNANAKDDD